MWCHNNVVECEQRTIGAGLNIEHVKSCTSNLSRCHCFSKCRFINDSATRNVDHAQVGLGLSQNFATDNALGLFGLWQVHRNEITLRNDVIEAHHFNIHLTSTFFRNKWIVCNETHTESKCALCDQLANATKTDNTKGLVGKFDTFPLAAFPTTGLQRGMGLGHIARTRQEQSHGVLGRRHDVALWSIDDHHAATRRGFNIDVVETDAGTSDHDEFVGELESLGSDLRG